MSKFRNINVFQNFDTNWHLKEFPFALQTIFPFITWKHTIYFSQLQFVNNFFNEKGTPPPPSPINIMVCPLGHFLAILNAFFLSKLPEIANFLLKIVIFGHFGYFSTFLVQNSFRRGGEGATFNFRPILADFHVYTLNMTSYHVNEKIYG